MPDYLLAIDQGTTSTRAILFDAALAPVATAQQEFAQIYPAPGLVEHDPEHIWATTIATVRDAMAKAGVGAGNIAAIGITNQRETTVVWDRPTGRPIHNAIVWQDRRTADRCAVLRRGRPRARDRGAHRAAARSLFLSDQDRAGCSITSPARVTPRGAGRLAFGTVDSFLLWRLTGGKLHATDATNAARTLLLDIRDARWDAHLCDLFGVPMALLPQVRDCAGDFGTTLPELFGGPIRILGVAGDQQAATIGQGCFQPGMMKATYGTGCFALLNTGAEPVASQATGS